MSSAMIRHTVPPNKLPGRSKEEALASKLEIMSEKEI